jgi:predicted NUDIX family phosphoesterase
MTMLLPNGGALLADRRLILAIAADNLNGLAGEMGEFISTEALREVGVISKGGDPTRAICEALSDCGAWFGPRRYLEETDCWRQLIPYLVLRNADKVLVYRRSDDIEEERLRGAYAVGFGGHIDLPDTRFNHMDELDLYQTVVQGAEREALEEVGLMVKASQLDCMGMILAAQPMVSRVHIGLVLVVPVVGMVASQENSQHSLEWLTADQLEAIPEDKQEGWTRVMVPVLRKYLQDE